MNLLRLLTGALLSLCLTWLPAAAQAPSGQAWPSRPIRILVPYAAGGAMDVLARLLAAKMQDQMGTPVIVENRSGAGGNIGADAVAKAAPDGYTILFNINGHAIAPAIYKTLPFNPAGQELSGVCRAGEIKARRSQLRLHRGRQFAASDHGAAHAGDRHENDHGSLSWRRAAVPGLHVE